MYKNTVKNTGLQASPIIVALDYSNKNSALAFADGIDPNHCRLKLGKKMFTLFGPQLVHDLQMRGFDVFLDLKFYDIPNTTAQAAVASAELGVWMINVHASGGTRMMTAVKKALLPYGKDAPILIAVTVLTSMEKDDLHAIGINASPAEHAERLARLAYDCGLDGVVCSAHEAQQIKASCGQAFQLITPGIRALGSPSNDQRRIMTIVQAIESGVDYIVIGRPITESRDPAATVRAIYSLLN